MTRVLGARIGDAGYEIHLGAGLLAGLGPMWAERAAGPNVLLVSDANLADHAARAALSLRAAGLVVAEAVVAPGESSKSFAELERIGRLAATAGIRRADAVIGLGGGVVGDLAGFVAASYQRGVRLVHVPTTLLAMVDSAIGGKTGIDIPEGKNYIGAIWQPEMVVMDMETLSTLPARELSCGFAEVIKYGLLDSVELFELVEGWPALPGPADRLAGLIEMCIAHKLRVVAADERDLGIRASLNLGHTVGHGIEAAAGYERYRHGEAISLGLLAALRIAESHCGLAPEWRRRTRAVLDRHDLPVVLHPEVVTDAVVAAMGRDKKASAGGLNMVGVGSPGDVRLGVNPAPEEIVAAIEELRG
ncbi:MAG: 3-dehydroquinate synthase [Miltoncostaeaceae bacterium]